MNPLQKLFERAELPSFGLPAPLLTTYGGDFGINPSHTFANFVSSVDGVVALPGSLESGRVVSGDSEADRFVMALLRACADVVVIGAGTFAQAHGGSWRPADAYPSLGVAFADLRKQMGLRPQPLLVVVTRSGNIDTTQPAAQDALIATTREGETRLHGRLPASARVIVLDPYTVPLARLLEFLRSENLQRVLSEGGPTLFGELVKANLIDELFLTVSPLLFGREARDGKKGLINGVELDGQPLELASARCHGSHLFLRYMVAHT